MKLLKILSILLILGIPCNSNAQFFKKLKDKAEKKIKNEAERRTQRRIDKKIDKTFDKAEDEIDDVTTKKKKKENTSSKTGTTKTVQTKNTTSKQQNNQVVANNQTVFKFSHIYSFKIQTEKKKPMQVDYFLKKDANYLASVLPDMKNNTISIMDFSNENMIMLMETGDSKTRMHVKMNFNSVSKDVEDKNISITKTGKKKKILGYNCEEYLAKGDDFTNNVWVTTDAGIEFPKTFQGGGNKKMKNQNNRWMFKMKGMALEMTVVDTSKKKPKTTKIICTKLAKEPRTIDISSYKKMM